MQAIRTKPTADRTATRAAPERTAAFAEAFPALARALAVEKARNPKATTNQIMTGDFSAKPAGGPKR